jgi:group I intron endonuclease
MTSGIYCIENIENGMKYIGKGKDVERRMYASHNKCPYIKNALTKYSKDSFIRYLIKSCEIEELNKWEKYYIKEWGTKAPSGYNLTDGGEGMFNPTEETRKKISIGHIGKVFSEEHIKNLKKSRAGRSMSPDVREKIRNTIRANIISRYGEKKNNATSSYYGVRGIKKKTVILWVFYLYENGKSKYMRSYKTEIEAALAYDEYIMKNNLKRPLNFPE